MKTYSEFVTEMKPCGCQDCDCNDNVVEEYQLDEGVIDVFVDAVNKVLRRDAAAMISKIDKATDKAREMITTAKVITQQVEQGKVKLKDGKDVENFRRVAMASGLYNKSGDRRDRSDKEVDRYVEVVIAKNKASQIKDGNIKSYFDSFLKQVNDNDYCGV